MIKIVALNKLECSQPNFFCAKNARKLSLKHHHLENKSFIWNSRFLKKMIRTQRPSNQIYFLILLSFTACVVITIQIRQYFSSEWKYNFANYDHLSFDIRYVEENFMHLNQSDPQLIQYTRAKYLTPPSKHAYNLANNESLTVLSEWVLKFFGENMRNGIFIEAGANDGEYGSNTLYLEKVLGWTGVLIECNPTLVPDIITKHRKAWVGNICLAPGSNPGNFNFRFPTGYTVAGTLGKPLNEDDANMPSKNLDVQGVPLYTILAALGWTEIDYFSFDIEGMEFQLLKHFPFDKVRFKVIIMEIQFYTEEEKEEIKKLMERNNYLFVSSISLDHIYVHRSVQYMIPK